MLQKREQAPKCGTNEEEKKNKADYQLIRVMKERATEKNFDETV
jgi:hypothetical protein